jgi:hypothetical protein
MTVLPITIKSYKHLISIIGHSGLTTLKIECEEINKEHNHNLNNPPPEKFNFKIKVYLLPEFFSIQVENANNIWYFIKK